MLKKAVSFLDRGVFGTEKRSGQDVAEYLFFIAVLVGVINAIKGTIQNEFTTQATKLFTP